MTRPDQSSDGAGPRQPSYSLECRDVRFSYGAHVVLEDLSFGVPVGQFVAILGPNGSGKTTLLRLALGLERPTGGRVLLFGTESASFRDWGKIGYVPQTIDGLQRQYPGTVTEVVAQGLYRGFDPLAALRRSGQANVEAALGTVGIQDLGDRKMATLSMGQQQRTLLARALVREPQLLVLDEPVAGVDAAAEEQFYALLRRLNGEMALTILMVTHDIGAVMREASTVACINRTLVFHGPAHQITQKELSTLYGFPMEVVLHDALHEHR